MATRAELLESALDTLTDGVALAGNDGQIAFWNRAAEIITGHNSSEVTNCHVRQMLEALLVGGARQWIPDAAVPVSGPCGNLFTIRHRTGYEIPIMARVIVLRDGLGIRIGTGVLFHPSDSIDALPDRRSTDESRVDESQSRLEDRLVWMHEEFRRGELPLGVLWVRVDQTQELRQSHGTAACEAMLQSLEKTIASGLKPAEEIGRWGDQEFLVLSHERSEVALSAHAQMLTGLARTAEFRWWGDRISLSVSIGAAQAREGESLSTLLKRGQTAMQASVYAGGNHITAAQQARENR